MRSDAAAADSAFLWVDGPGDIAGSFLFPFLGCSICKYEDIFIKDFSLSLSLLMFCT